MKTASQGLTAHLTQETTNLCRLLKITRADGVQLYFTDFDENLLYDTSVEGVNPSLFETVFLYVSADGLTVSALELKDDGSPNNCAVTGFLNDAGINEHDVNARLYDNATFELRTVNWSDLTQGPIKMLSGTIGDVILERVGGWQIELRGLTQKLTTQIGKVYGPTCRAELFGGGAEGIDPHNHFKCRLNRADWVQNGTVTLSPDALTIIPFSEPSIAEGLEMVGSATPDLPAPAGWFNDGIITFTSGVLNGYSFEIATWDGAILGLFGGAPLPFAPSPGDTFEIEPGCDKVRSTCSNTFSNIVNFAGEADIPGLNVISATGRQQVQTN